MEIIVAEASGFCYGVRRALEIVVEAARAEGNRMYTLGPLIHNPQVVEQLERDGIKVVEDVHEVPPGGIIVVPSHGVPKETMARAKQVGLEIVDVMCPFVRKVQRLAARLHQQGYQVIVVGDNGHTEVRSIMSMAGDDALAVSDAAELASRRLKRRVAIVAQTTQTLDKYKECIQEAAGRTHEVRAYNTICDATAERQGAAADLAKDADVVLVVGGRNSANTKRLAQICASTGVPSYHIEIADEMDENWFQGARKVGITAGASTPDWIIDEVVERVKAI